MNQSAGRSPGHKPDRIRRNQPTSRASAGAVLSPRAMALDLLAAVLGHHRPLNEAFHGHKALARLEPRDRAFALNLAATTLRRLGQIDALIDHFLSHPLPKEAKGVRDLLRLGICQLIFLETPAHAAVDTTVTLAQRRRRERYAALINAVLRRVASDGRSLADDQDAARLNTPEWLWRAWTKSHGEETCRRIAEAHLGEPPLDLTIRGNADDLVQALDATVLPTGTLRLNHRGPVTALPGFDEGRWWVQDAAAALPVRLLGDVRGLNVLDLCAAPGGKTAQLVTAGAHVTALDRAPERLQRLERNLARLRLRANTVAADAGEWRPTQPADAVIVDVPCSATGTIRRHPDVAWLKKASDVASLVPPQSRLLAAAAEMVKPGGLLVYCSCSLQPEEGLGHIEAFLSRQPTFRRVPVTPEEVGGLAELITAAGDLRTLPCHLAGQGGMDGFYAARLLRQ